MILIIINGERYEIYNYVILALFAGHTMAGIITMWGLNMK